MIISLVHNHYDPDHLSEVIEEMKALGAPTIKIIDLEFENRYQALEGCHRLRAAESLGLTPIFEIVSPESTAGDLELDVDDPDTLAEEIGDWENYQIEFEI